MRKLLDVFLMDCWCTYCVGPLLMQNIVRLLMWLPCSYYRE